MALAIPEIPQLPRHFRKCLIFANPYDMYKEVWSKMTVVKHFLCTITYSGYVDYIAFHRFWQAKFAYGCIHFRLKPIIFSSRLPKKKTLASKVVKNDSKIIILLDSSKSVTHCVAVGMLHAGAYFILPPFRKKGGFEMNTRSSVTRRFDNYLWNMYFSTFWVLSMVFDKIFFDFASFTR